uniref:Serine protease family S09X putative n=1 Tax=Albugo laibachii Nc14 TaxID=890382 RepID=F0WU85_9STRA|nr:serine protease family S09X putative [Albugo laibachii Nc14]|eukprot:CCA24963.1 serine protease family S09X putative [Albugo laibachii Nc14]
MEERDATEKRGVWEMIKSGYDELLNSVIRPMRAEYCVSDLGDPQLYIPTLRAKRVDFQLKNDANYTLECSWWRPLSLSQDNRCPSPCIVFLHGNSSCRLGALEIVSYALPAGFSVFALDFAGSGMSQGKYVSLGYHEQRDIATVVEYIRSEQEDCKIVLWGRSMGAVASLLYAEKDPAISVLVLDSPFSSLRQLALELVQEGKLGVPKILVKFVMQMLRQDIKRRAKFDIYKLKPIDLIHRCSIPSFFLTGLQDELVGPHHSKALFRLHNGPKELFTFRGGHNSPRPFLGYFEALQFVRVMVGLLPLEMNASLPVQSPTRTKVFYNPLPPGTYIESVDQMSVRDLKAAIQRAGYEDVPCIEKKDMVDLVTQLYSRYLQYESIELSSF